MSEPNPSDLPGHRIPIEQMERLFHLAVAETPVLQRNSDTWNGFIVGFRCYERIANALGVAVTSDDVHRVVPQGHVSTKEKQ